MEVFENEGSASCVDGQKRRFTKTITSIVGKQNQYGGLVMVDGRKRYNKASVDAKRFIRFQITEN